MNYLEGSFDKAFPEKYFQMEVVIAEAMDLEKQTYLEVLHETMTWKETESKETIIQRLDKFSGFYTRCPHFSSIR